METLNLAATRVAAMPSRSSDLGAIAAAPSHEPAIDRWPGWARLTILIGGSAALWAGLAWVAVLVFKLS